MINQEAARAYAVIVAAGLMLGGCESAKQSLATAKTAMIQTATTVKEKVESGVQVIREKIGPPQLPVTVDDGSECYKHQVAFDQATHAVAMADYNAKLATAGAIGMGIIALAVDSTGGKIAAGAAALLLASLALQLKNDRDLIVEVTRTTNELTACRSRELRALRAQARAGKEKREEAATRLVSLKTTLTSQAERAKTANETLKARDKTYREANEKQKKEALPPKNAAEQKEREQKAKEVEEALLTNQRVLEQQAASLKEAEALAQTDLELSRLPGDEGRRLSLSAPDPRAGGRKGEAA